MDGLTHSSDRHHEIQFIYKRADSEYNPHKISLNINDECLFPRPAMCLLVIVMPYNVFGCKYIAIFLNVHIKRKLSLYKINEDKSRTRQFATMQKNTVTSQSLQRHLTRVTHAPSISCHCVTPVHLHGVLYVIVRGSLSPHPCPILACQKWSNGTLKTCDSVCVTIVLRLCT